MTDLYALAPKQALEVIRAAGVEDAAKLIRDHTAAGLVRSYAQLQVTINARGERTCVRGGVIATDAWERMICESADGDVWGGGTVRLAGSDLVGGAPALHVTGVAFHTDDIDRLANQQRPAPRTVSKRQKLEAGAEGKTIASEPIVATPSPQRADPTAIQPGAILCTIKQAQAALGLGRTKVNEMMNDGRLVRRQIDGGVRLEVASVWAIAGLSG